jgi:ribosomal protein S18 acetylase RimI-like enzyme
VTSPELVIRPAERHDFARLWPIMEPVIRDGLTNALPRDMGADAAADYWFAPGTKVFLAEAGGEVLGTYHLRANQQGGGAHIANAGFMTAPWARRRGIARAMAAHALATAAALGFAAMQFNFVISSNERAVRLWRGLGFTIVGTLPDAFRLPDGRLVDVFVMYRRLNPPPAPP